MNTQTLERQTRDTVQRLQSELSNARIALGRRLAFGEDADAERERLAAIRQELDDAEAVLMALPYIAIEVQERAYTTQSGPSREEMQARIAAFEKRVAEFNACVNTARSSGPDRVDAGARLLLAARACNSGLREADAKQKIKDNHLKLDDVQRRADQLRGRVNVS
jgi:hypothetical protein